MHSKSACFRWKLLRLASECSFSCPTPSQKGRYVEILQEICPALPPFLTHLWHEVHSAARISKRQSSIADGPSCGHLLKQCLCAALCQHFDNLWLRSCRQAVAAMSKGEGSSAESFAFPEVLPPAVMRFAEMPLKTLPGFMSTGGASFQHCQTSASNKTPGSGLIQTLTIYLPYKKHLLSLGV